MMGMSLMYSLFNASDIAKLNAAKEPGRTPLRAIAPATPKPVSTPPTHALGAPPLVAKQPRFDINPQVNEECERNSENVAPSSLEMDLNLVPFNPTTTENEKNDGFDLAKILKAFQEDSDEDDMLVQATQEAEKNPGTIVHKNSSTLIRRNQNPMQMPSFSKL